MSEKTAEKVLRGLLIILVLWDFGLAVVTIGWPHFVLELGRFEVKPEPLWTRGVGVYWGFAGWFQLLGWRDPRRYVACVQLSIVFRISAAAIDLVEALWLLPRPMFLFHYLLLFFVAMNLAIAGVTAYCLRRMGLRALEFRAPDAT